MPPNDVDVLILGAGPTGLGAAWRLKELGDHGLLPSHIKWHLVEGRDEAGGLARSVVDDHGFTWDFGCHVIYSHYKYFDELYRHLLGGDFYEHPRKNWVFLDDHFIPFPIQENFHLLDDEVVREILSDLTKRQGKNHDKAATFEDWLRDSYGPTLTEMFFHPYNRKMWGVSPKELSTEWTSRKSGSRFQNVAPVVLEAMQKRQATGESAPGWIDAPPFLYPKSGGNGALWKAIVKQLPQSNLSFGQKVEQIDVERREAILEDGSTIRWKRIISTIPLDKLVNICHPDPDSAIREYAAELAHSSVHFFGLGFRGHVPEKFQDKYWIHCVPKELPFFRATVISNYSPQNVPSNQSAWSLLLEVTSTRASETQKDSILRDCISGASSVGWINEADMLTSWHDFSAYGYPLPTGDRDIVLKNLLPFFEKKGVLPRGRFGGWKFEASNQDNTFMQGLEAVDHILFGAEEITYNYPELLNEGIAGRIPTSLA